MYKKAPPITYGGKLEEKIDRLSEHFTVCMDAIDDRLSALEGEKTQPKKKTDDEILMAVAKYFVHRFLRHNPCGAHKALTKNEFKRLEEMIKEQAEE